MSLFCFRMVVLTMVSLLQWCKRAIWELEDGQCGTIWIWAWEVCLGHSEFLLYIASVKEIHYFPSFFSCPFCICVVKWNMENYGVWIWWVKYILRKYQVSYSKAGPRQQWNQTLSCHKCQLCSISIAKKGWQKLFGAVKLTSTLPLIVLLS